MMNEDGTGERGMKKQKPRIKFKDGVPVLDLPKPERLITTERVKAIQEEMDDEEAREVAAQLRPNVR
jgi:hypothetical protein